MLEALGVRTVDSCQIQGVYISPSAVHGVALLQPGYFSPERPNQTPDFCWQVNNTLLKLFLCVTGK